MRGAVGRVWEWCGKAREGCRKVLEECEKVLDKCGKDAGRVQEEYCKDAGVMWKECRKTLMKYATSYRRLREV